MDVQPKCLAVGPGGYTVVLCIGQVSIHSWTSNTTALLIMQCMVTRWLLTCLVLLARTSENIIK